MQKPVGYESVEAASNYDSEKIKSGAYIMKILKAVDKNSSKGHPMITFLLDVAEGKHSGYYKKLFDFLKSKNQDAKWPLVYYRRYDEEQLRFFKSDIIAIENSNYGYKFSFDERTLAGKIVGSMLVEKELDSGKIVLEPKYLCSVDKVKSGELVVPDRKCKIETSENEYNKYNGKEQQENNDDGLPF